MISQRLRIFLLAGVVAPAIMTLLGLWVALVVRDERLDLLRLPGPSAILWAVLAVSGSMGIVTLLYKSHKGLERALRESGTQAGLDALNVAGYPLMLVIVVGAAIGEEILFRGGLQPSVGLVPAALLFGFSHGGWRRDMWAYAFAAALAGLVFGTAYWLTGDVWVPVLAHSIHNVLSTLLLGKNVDVTWDGPIPHIRLVPDPSMDAETVQETVQYPAELPPIEVDADAEPIGVDEPLPTEADSPANGSDDRNPASGDAK